MLSEIVGKLIGINVGVAHPGVPRTGNAPDRRTELPRRRVAAGGEPESTVVNSASGETVTLVPFSTSENVDAAVQAGLSAFETWRNTPVEEERIQPLFVLKQLLEANQDDFAETLVEEHGKIFAEAKGELRRGIENVEVACGIPSMMQAGHLPNAAPNIDETAIH